MSKELPGGTQNDFGVFSLLRNFDRYNDDNFKLSDTPPGGQNSPPNASVLKNRFQTFGQEEKSTVIIHSSGTTVVGFSPSVSSLVTRVKSEGKDSSADQAESNPDSNRVITGEVWRNRLSAMTLGAELPPPHSGDKLAPSSQTIVKMYEKAVGIHSSHSQSQPSSPRLPRKIFRNASIENFDKIVGRQGQMKGELIMAGKSQEAAVSSVLASSTEKEHQRLMTAVPETSTDSTDSSFQQMGKTRSALGQWLWGKESKVTVKDRELNFISPTSF